MSILDRLFYRELQRRTGARAIQIYIDQQNATRARSRSLGKSALKRHGTKITQKTDRGSLFHRIDIRLPWLKLFAVLILGVIAIIDLLDLTISSVGDSSSRVKVAPMSHHVKVTERTIEGKMLVALTFDDGPSPTTTPRLLEILTEKDAPATFFMLGNMARTYPDIAKNVAKNHHEIASHTMYHQNLVTLPDAAIQSDIGEAKSVLNEITGQNPLYTRPPYGNINDAVRASVGTPMILWSVDTRDWQSKDPGAIVSVAMSQVHDGAIILMHDIYPTSVDAVPALIDTLRQAGYELVTISELAKSRNVAPAPGAVYYNFRP